MPPQDSSALAGTILQMLGDPALAAELHRLAAEVFTYGYVTAMRWTMVLPIAVIALAAVSCLAIQREGGADRAPPALQWRAR